MFTYAFFAESLVTALAVLLVLTAVGLVVAIVACVTAILMKKLKMSPHGTHFKIKYYFSWYACTANTVLYLWSLETRHHACIAEHFMYRGHSFQGHDST